MGRRQSPSNAQKDIIGLKCANCGSDENLQYHHIVPLSCGGNDVITNMVCLCGKCHGLLHLQGNGWMNHSELVKNGIQKAKAQGRTIGAKRKYDRERIMRIIAENSTQFNPYSLMTESEVISIAGVGYTMYHQCKRELLGIIKNGTWPFGWTKPSCIKNHAESARKLSVFKPKGAKCDA